MIESGLCPRFFVYIFCSDSFCSDSFCSDSFMIVPKRKRQAHAKASGKNITLLGFTLLFALLCNLGIVMCIVMSKSLIYKQCYIVMCFSRVSTGFIEIKRGSEQVQANSYKPIVIFVFTSLSIFQ